MSNCLTRCIGSHCLREDLLWKYNQTALQRYQFDKNFQNEEGNFDPFQCSGGVGKQAKLWGSKLEENHQPCVCSSSWCGARVICKLESMEGESFYKPFHFPLPECFSFKNVVVGNQCPPSVCSTRSSINLWFSGSSVGVGGVVLTDECILRLWRFWYFWMIIKIMSV